MSEEGGVDGEFDVLADIEDGVGDGDGRFLNWAIGLPSDEDLTPLSQVLVPLELASAFGVSPEPKHTALDVHRASVYTISNLCRAEPSAAASDALLSFSTNPTEEEMESQGSDPMEDDGSSHKISELGPESSSAALMEAGPSTPHLDESCDDPSTPNRKRPRLAWTPYLHKRFIDVVKYLGIRNAVPKAIMQMMNVEGLTRENVASHLQKYRLYLKRTQSIPDEATAPSPPDHPFASMLPATKNLPRQHVRTPKQYPMPAVIPVSIFGLNHPSGPDGLVTNHRGNGPCHAFEQQHSNRSVSERLNDWYGLETISVPWFRILTLLLMIKLLCIYFFNVASF